VYLGGHHVVQLRPLLWSRPAAIALAPLAVEGPTTILPTLCRPSVPHNLNRRVVGKRPRQQLEGSEVPSTHDHNICSGHMQFVQLTFSPQTAFDRDPLG
jgi:hypothetical protein